MATLNRPDDASASATALQSRWPEVAGWHIHVLSGGELAAARRPVLLLHGIGMSSRDLRGLALALASDFQVFVPDQPGFGDSDKPRRALELTELGAFVVRLMDALGFERAAPLGNSFGCGIAVEVAVTPSRARGRAGLAGPDAGAARAHGVETLGALARQCPARALSRPGRLGGIPARRLPTCRANFSQHAARSDRGEIAACAGADPGRARIKGPNRPAKVGGTLDTATAARPSDGCARCGALDPPLPNSATGEAGATVPARPQRLIASMQR